MKDRGLGLTVQLSFLPGEEDFPVETSKARVLDDGLAFTRTRSVNWIVSTMHALVRVGPLISAALSINFHQSVSNFLQSITFRPDTLRAIPRVSSHPLVPRDSLYLYIKLMVGEAISFANTVSRNKVIAPRIVSPRSLKAPSVPFRVGNFI